MLPLVGCAGASSRVAAAAAASAAVGAAMNPARWRALPIALALLGIAVAPAALAAPAAGRYAAELCVTDAAAARNCGPAALQLRRGAARVQVSDIVYRLKLHERGRADVVMTQGAMQLDEFSSDYEWDGRLLRFVDLEKRLLYEVQVGARRGAAGGD